MGKTKASWAPRWERLMPGAGRPEAGGREGLWPGRAGLLACWLPGARVTRLPGPTGTHNSPSSLASPSPWQSWAQEGAACCDFLPSLKNLRDLLQGHFRRGWGT